MNNIEFLENLIDVIKAQSSFNDVDMALLKGINRIINERWITIHPHGEDSEDYRRLKLEDGETPKEAIDRVYKKGDKGKEPKEEPKQEPQESAEDISKKIEELTEKARRFGGAGTVLGQKYLKQVEDLKKQQKEIEKKALDSIKGDDAIVNKLSEIAKQIRELNQKKWDYSLSRDERAEAGIEIEKLNDQSSELAKKLSFMGDSWQNATGGKVTISDFKDGKYVVTTDRSTSWGISKDYSYYSDIEEIKKLKDADIKGYEKAQKKKQEKELRTSKKVDYKKGAIPKAKTREEAEKIAIEYNIADTINYGNLSADICNALNESANDIYAEFPKVRSLNKEFGSLQAKNKNLIDEAFEVQGEALAIPIRAKIERLRKDYGEDYIERHYGNADTLEKKIAEEVKKKLKSRLNISRASGEIAHCRYSPPSQLGIVWNEKYKNIKDIDYTCEAGFHPKDSGSLKAVADHEFGHLIDRFIQLKGTSSSTSYKALESYYRTLSREDIKTGLSGYAATKFAEFIAEGFSEYKNSPQPRPMAQKIGKLLTQAYKEVEDNV